MMLKLSSRSWAYFLGVFNLVAVWTFVEWQRGRVAQPEFDPPVSRDLGWLIAFLVFSAVAGIMYNRTAKREDSERND